LREHRLLRLLVVAGSVFALISRVAAGCGGSGASDPALKARLAEANAHLTKSADYIKQLGGFKKSWTEALGAGVTPESVAKLKELLNGARKIEEQALGEIRAASRELASARSLEVSDSMGTYLDMKLDAVDEQDKVLSTELEAMDLRIQTAEAIGAGSQLDQATVLREQRISQLEEESKQHTERAAELHKKANEYYKNKKLGR